MKFRLVSAAAALLLSAANLAAADSAEYREWEDQSVNYVNTEPMRPDCVPSLCSPGTLFCPSRQHLLPCNGLYPGLADEHQGRLHDCLVPCCQCRGPRFNPWSRKIPHAPEQL